MQYHLDTIPVWEALEKDTPCLFCAMHAKLEEQQIERSLGGSVMEPDERVQVNAIGICDRHHNQLFQMKNRLGHALMTDTRSMDVITQLEKLERKAASPVKKGLFSKGDDSSIAAELRRIISGCVICNEIDASMMRYYYTFVHLWKTDSSFRRKWEASKGMCIPHAAMVIDMAQSQLSGSKQTEFNKAVIHQLKECLTQDEADLNWFTLKFDYRNHDKPWGNSRDALERTANRLRGECIKSDAPKT